MKAFIIYLKEVQSTVDSALECKRTAREHGLDAWMLEGFTPSRADKFIEEQNLKPYLPGPKLYNIKWQKGGVRGCMISHYHAWKKCVELDQKIVILEHDSRVVSETYTQDFEDVLHLDGYRFEDDPNVGKTPIVENFTNIRKGENQLKGTYGYVIKPHAAKRLIQGAHDDGITASDMFIKDKYVKIQVVKPRAVYVNSQDSLTGDRSFYI
jgi:GR25 family glycosyltransferase involved in LPS biosynthesis